jgi:signal transduction histidine kinase
MIEKYSIYFTEVQEEAPRQLILLSIISQGFVQPFSVEDNLLVLLTALTSGSGVGFNRAMLFLKDDDTLRGEMWLGPKSAKEAQNIWEVLSTPGIGYVEVIEYNRSLVSKSQDTLSRRVRNLRYPLRGEALLIPALPARDKDILLVKDARNEPLVDKAFQEIIGVDEFVCIPLLARNEIFGEIILDNAFTGAPIAPLDIKLAVICALFAGNYVYSAALHRKLVEAEKMAALGEMAVFVTHQIRNPLATIGGFTEQLLQPGLNGEKKERNLRIIQAETKRLEDVVYQIAHFLKVTLKEPIAFDVRPVLESVIESPEIRMKAQRRGVRMNVRIAKCTPQVLCDPTYVGEVFRNILENAIDATPAEGKISVLAYAKNEKSFVLSVKDTGRGIAEADKAKLFTPFFTTKEKGMGLGLPFVKRVMDACGGRIEVESREGKGTLFRLLFQCQERRTLQ